MSRWLQTFLLVALTLGAVSVPVMEAQAQRRGRVVVRAGGPRIFVGGGPVRVWHQRPVIFYGGTGLGLLVAVGVLILVLRR